MAESWLIFSDEPANLSRRDLCRVAGPVQAIHISNESPLAPLLKRGVGGILSEFLIGSGLAGSDPEEGQTDS